MYIMAKKYAHILQPEMRKAVAAFEGSVTPEASPGEGKKKPVKSERPESREQKKPRGRKSA